MKSAFKRELFVLKHNLFYIIYILCFAVIAVLENCIDNEGTFFCTMITFLMSCAYILNTAVTEPTFKFDKQIMAFPTTPGQIVFSKYIIALGYSFFVSTVLILVKQLLFVVEISKEDVLPWLSFFWACYGICLMAVGLSLIVGFAFGMDKAIGVMIGFIFILGFISGFTEEELSHILFSWASSFHIELIFIGVIGILVYILTLPLNMKLYTRRIQK